MSLFAFCHAIFLAIFSCSQVGTVDRNLMRYCPNCEENYRDNRIFIHTSLFSQRKHFSFPLLVRTGPHSKFQIINLKGESDCSGRPESNHDFLTSLFCNKGRSWQWLLIKKPIMSATLMDLKNITFGCFLHVSLYYLCLYMVLPHL